ncbi:MAG: M24 family metallopeptidase [Candidatus Kryptoniota bacterium]
MKLTELQKHSIEAVEHLQAFLRANSIDAFFVSSPHNVRYLTNFTGSAGNCLVFKDESFFLTDFRYRTQAKDEVVSSETVVFKGDLIHFIKKRFFKNNSKANLAVEDSLSIKEFDEIVSVLPNLKVKKTSQVIEKLAAVKSNIEIDLIIKANKISQLALETLLEQPIVGKSEKELAATIEYNQKIFGASKESFDTIVASGFRGAMPHGVASGKLVKKDEFVTFDFGSFYSGYASDITRTFRTGRKTESVMMKVFKIVMDAQRRAIEKAKAGVAAKQVDKAARDYIERKGYGRFFGHGTGHGIGLRIHELPKVSQFSDDILMEGNVITIEPGIYLPGTGGVRIEDDFLVTSDGLKCLTDFPKDVDYYLEKR